MTDKTHSVNPSMGLFDRWLDRLEARRVARNLKRRARFRARCAERGIPDDVADRLLRAGATHIDWYAGRHDG